MHLSWNEIRARASRFAHDWRDANYERGETQTFYNEFFEVFGVNRRRVASFEEPVRKLGNQRGFIDLFWKGVLLVEQKSAGRSLVKAREQALDYFPGLKDQELPRYRDCPRQIFSLHRVTVLAGRPDPYNDANCRQTTSHRSKWELVDRTKQDHDRDQL